MTALATLAHHWDVVRASWSAEREQEAAAKAGVKAKGHELEFLPAVLEVTETPASPAGRAVALAVIVFFNIAATWALLGKIDIIAIAEGKVIPTVQVQMVQPLETGVVRRIRVREGEKVARGQVLVELDPTGSEADALRLAREHAGQAMEVARLEALLADDPAEAFVAPEGLAGKAADEMRRLVASQWKEHRARLAGLGGEQARIEAEAATIEAEIGRLSRLLPKVRERVEGKRGLADTQVIARLSFTELEEQLIEREGQLEVQKRKLAESRANAAAARARRAQSEAEFQRDALSRLAEARTKTASLEQELKKARERNRQQTLVAPVDGTVLKLVVHTEGGVVTPAQELMKIVPADAQLEAEVQVLNKDIGFVRDGQAAEIKLDSYPFTRYGTIAGALRHVSPDSVQDEKLGLVYPTRVTLARATMTVDGKEVALQPGMGLSAEVKTGQRRIIEYLLSPIKRYRHDSMRER
ncbi:MAG: HlyD family type I secretion periplasmic adaptor subunit [Magnetospirillum sp. WYHS-4]